MTKQLMIYENAVPISAEAHRNTSVKSGDSFAFAAGINSVPIVAAEFEKASAEYPIVFAGEGEAIAPAIVLGLKDGENLFLKDNGGWDAAYVPAFLRRYPFVFATTGEDGETLTLCLDTAYEGVNEEGRGERLFDSAGERTGYLKTVLQFTTDYQAQHNLTRQLVAKLLELKLLEPATAQVTMPDGTSRTLAGFQRVSAERLRALDDATVVELFRSDMLMLIYAHLGSLSQLNELMKRAAAATEPKAA